MLAPSVYSQKGIFERVVRARNGALMRVCFEVYEINGEMKGRVLSATPVFVIPAQAGIQDHQTRPLYLPAFISNKKVVTEYVRAFAPVISPLNTLFFFTSQPTRAPSLN